MGGNQRDASTRDQQKDQWHEKRDDDRQAGNLRQHKCRFVFVDGASPDNPGAGGGQTVVAPITIPAGMQVEGSGFRLLPVGEAGRTDHRCREANPDEQAGDQRKQTRDLPGSTTGMHGAEHLRHGPHLSEKKALNL